MRSVFTAIHGHRNFRRNGALLLSVLLYCAASLLHFVHNGLYLRDYPNLPTSLTASDVYLAWLGVTAVGAAGYGLYLRGLRIAGLCVLAVYAVLGFAGLDHYMVAPVAAHSIAMNATIVFEVLAAIVLLSVVAHALFKRERP
jgi:hypothetical protein